MVYKIKRFSRYTAVKHHTGVIEQDEAGNWRIISTKTGKYWPQKYKSEESAQSALRGYHASHGK